MGQNLVLDCFVFLEIGGCPFEGLLLELLLLGTLLLLEAIVKSPLDYNGQLGELHEHVLRSWLQIQLVICLVVVERVMHKPALMLLRALRIATYPPWILLLLQTYGNYWHYLGELLADSGWTVFLPVQGDVADSTAVLKLLGPWYRGVGHEHRIELYDGLNSSAGDLTGCGICILPVLLVVKGYGGPSLTLQTHGDHHLRS